MSNIDFLLSNYSNLACSAILLNPQQKLKSESLKPILKNKSPKKLLNFTKFSKNIQKLISIPENPQQASSDLKNEKITPLEEINYKRENYKQDDSKIDLQYDSKKNLNFPFSDEKKTLLENKVDIVNLEEDEKNSNGNIKHENFIFPFESNSSQTLETCSSENNSFKTLIEHNDNHNFVKSIETKKNLMIIEENDPKIVIENDQQGKKKSEGKNEENGKQNSKSKSPKKSAKKVYFRETKVKFKKPLEEVFSVESYKEYNIDMSEAIMFMGVACSCKKNLCEIF